jgi:predicted kinase
VSYSTPPATMAPTPFVGCRPAKPEHDPETSTGPGRFSFQGPTFLHVLRGLPASGKTTYALAEVAKYTNVVRVNRDTLRAMMYGPGYYGGDPTREDTVTVAEHGAICALLSEGINVIVDDTNLHNEHVQDLHFIGDSYDAVTEVKDRFLTVPLAECIARDATRPAGPRVGAERIGDMWRRFTEHNTGTCQNCGDGFIQLEDPLVEMNCPSCGHIPGGNR